ncbi:DNA-directed primase/polymerase protein [Porphyridium purpureum]|uniref:DNA-directed primase/polymerase protein n=1 Tax=Porphyridium purpureum TaxID=35688 RepID=A0A5J4YZD2_PORPP|nr:DNA-directed primase/polymerase protein [Porphyridium purpureum]|eukprot:POR4804..scf208_2
MFRNLNQPTCETPLKIHEYSDHDDNNRSELLDKQDSRAQEYARGSPWLGARAWHARARREAPRKRIRSVQFYGDSDGSAWTSHSVLEVGAGVRHPFSTSEQRRALRTAQVPEERIYREFPTQAEAMRFATAAPADDTAISAASERNAPRLACFARELDGSGRRRFIVATYREFVRRYAQLWREQGSPACHFYELIPANHPCKLYLDVEFRRCSDGVNVAGPASQSALETSSQLLLPRASNVASAPTLVLRLGEIIQELLQEVYKVDELACRKMMILDSSTPSKFSVHLIFPDVVFASNGAMGEFVELVQAHSPELWLEQDDGTAAHIIDMGVYSRNRCFRMLGSTKHGKQAALSLCQTQVGDAYVPLPSFSQDDLLRSLVCNVPVDLLCLAPKRCLGTVRPDSGRSSAGSRAMMKANGTIPASHTSSAAPPSTLAPARKENPDIDAFVSTLIWINRDASSHEAPRITRVIPLGDAQLAYWIGGGYRFCARIERHHKSNGVVIVCDLARRLWFQRCFDPDCRAARFQSAAMPLPVRISGEMPRPLA